VLLIVILIVLSLMFGGFQKGTRVGGLGAASAGGPGAVPVFATWC
jgi:hypothetical protein